MSVASMAMSEFRVGHVLSRSMSILARNIVPFGLLALLFTTPSFVASVMFDPQAGIMDPKTMRAIELGNEAALYEVLWLAAAAVGLVLLGMVLGTLANATMVYGTFQDLRGTPAGIGASMRYGLRAVLPILGVAFLTMFLIMLCIPLLVFPALMMMTALWVAVPAAVVERPGVVASLRRSADLTRGYRWRVFGIFVALALIAGVAGGIVQAPFVASMVTAGPQGMNTGTLLVAHGLGLIVNAFFAALSAVSSAVAYHDLRAVKEGYDIDQFAAIFD